MPFFIGLNAFYISAGSLHSFVIKEELIEKQVSKELLIFICSKQICVFLNLIFLPQHFRFEEIDGVFRTFSFIRLNCSTFKVVSLGNMFRYIVLVNKASFNRLASIVFIMVTHAI